MRSRLCDVQGWVRRFQCDGERIGRVHEINACSGRGIVGLCARGENDPPCLAAGHAYSRGAFLTRNNQVGDQGQLSAGFPTSHHAPPNQRLSNLANRTWFQTRQHRGVCQKLTEFGGRGGLTRRPGKDPCAWRAAFRRGAAPRGSCAMQRLFQRLGCPAPTLQTSKEPRQPKN